MKKTIFCIMIFLFGLNCLASDLNKCVDSIISIALKRLHLITQDTIKKMSLDKFEASGLWNTDLNIEAMRDYERFKDELYSQIPSIISCGELTYSISPNHMTGVEVMFNRGLLNRFLHKRLNNVYFNAEKDLHDFTEKDFLARDSMSSYNSFADTLGGVYIPKDLMETYNFISEFFPGFLIDKFKNRNEEEIFGDDFDSQGIMFYWSLVRNSRLYNYFADKGVTNSNEIANIILLYWHKRLNGKEINIESILRYKRSN